MSRKLPEFQKPPLIEVVLGVQFEALPGFKSAHAGTFWNRIRSTFPAVEERLPLPPSIERFGGKSRRGPLVRWQVSESPSAVRHWFLTKNGDQLIQIQPDRLIHNWRKRGTDETYPRYENIRSSFEDEWSLFLSFLSDEGEPKPEVNQCEVTYVNHILPGGVWERHSQVGRVLKLISQSEDESPLPEMEDVRMDIRYVIPSPQDGTPLGRLRISATPGFQADGDTPLIVLKLTARGEPIGSGAAGILSFMDLGREWIVRGFASITTPDMQAAWERLDV